MMKVFSFIIVASVYQCVRGAPWLRDTQDNNIVPIEVPSNSLTQQAQQGDVFLENTDPEQITDTSNEAIPPGGKLQPSVSANANAGVDGVGGAANADLQVPTPSMNGPPLNDSSEETALANEPPNVGLDSYFANPMSLLSSLLNEMAAERQALQQLMFANTPFAGAGMRMPPFPSMRMPPFDMPPPSPSPSGALSPSSMFSMWPSNLNSLTSSIDKMLQQQQMQLVNHDIINEKDGKLKGEKKEWQSPPDPNRRARAKMANLSYNDDNVQAHATSYSSTSMYNSNGLDPNASADEVFAQMPTRSSVQLTPGSFAFTTPRFRYY